MTVPSSVAKSGPYICNGVTDVFNYDFRIVDKSHLNVILTDANGAETSLTLTTHYTVSDVGSDTGSINLTAAGVALAITGTTLTILRNPPFTQETDLQNQGAYLAQTVEDRFDLAVMQIQTIKEKVDRAIVIPASDNSTTGDELSNDIRYLADNVDDIYAAANRAEAAASGIEGSPVYKTKALAEAITPATAPSFIDIAGRDSANDGRGGRFAYYGTTEPTHKRWLKITLSDGVTDVYYVSTRPVHVIFASGQSNMGLGDAITGLGRPNNIYIWNMLDPDTDPLGDAFIDGGGDFAMISLCYAAEYVHDHPDADVYVINIARHSYGIAQWLPDPATGLDMYAIIQNNVTAALAQIGMTRVDEFLWWQGEADYNSTTYVTDWITFYARLLGESWFSWDTPIKLFGISTYGTPSLGNPFNKNLTKIAATYPNMISYVHTATGSNASWDPTNDYVHLLISSIPEKARLAYNAKPFNMAWPDPWIGMHIAAYLSATRISPTPTDSGAGVVMNPIGNILSFAAGTGANTHLSFYNDAANTPELVGSLISQGTKLSLSAPGSISLATGTLSLTTTFTVITNDLVVAADDTAAATAGVVVGAIYEDASNGCLRRRKA